MRRPSAVPSEPNDVLTRRCRYLRNMGEQPWEREDKGKREIHVEGKRTGIYLAEASRAPPFIPACSYGTAGLKLFPTLCRATNMRRWKHLSNR